MERPADIPVRNVKLLQTTMNYVEKHPEQHDQTNWVNHCNTAFCYAGHAAIIAGATRPPNEATAWGNYWMVNPETLESHASGAYDAADRSLAVDEFAAKELGITMAEAEALFDGDRTITGLRTLVDALCTGAWLDDYGNIYVDDTESTYVEDWLVERGAEESKW